MMLRRKKFWVWFAIALWHPRLAFICLVILEMLADPYLMDDHGQYRRPHRSLNPASKPAIGMPRVLGAAAGGIARGAAPLAFPVLPARSGLSASVLHLRAPRKRTRYSAHRLRRRALASIGEAGSI